MIRKDAQTAFLRCVFPKRRNPRRTRNRDDLPRALSSEKRILTAKTARKTDDFPSPNTHHAAGGIETQNRRTCLRVLPHPNTHNAACGIETAKSATRKIRRHRPNTHYAACGFVQIGVGHKKALHLPLGERNAFRMQLIRHRVLTQMRTNDRIEIQKGHCLAVAPITSEISPPGFGRRKAGFSLLSSSADHQYGKHNEKCYKSARILDDSMHT